MAAGRNLGQPARHDADVVVVKRSMPPAPRPGPTFPAPTSSPTVPTGCGAARTGRLHRHHHSYRQAADAQSTRVPARDAYRSGNLGWRYAQLTPMAQAQVRERATARLGTLGPQAFLDQSEVQLTTAVAPDPPAWEGHNARDPLLPP
jgi:hypothetical protein